LDALLLQARQTQATIQQLQTQEPQSPSIGWRPEMPALSADSGTAWAAGTVLLVTAGALWWIAQRRHWVRVHPDHVTHAPVQPGASDFAPVPATPTPPPVSMPVATANPSRPGNPAGFDSEAAANEVTRVRTSLANKRRARALLRQSEENARNAPVSTLSGLFVDDTLQHPDIDLGLLEPSAVPDVPAFQAALPFIDAVEAQTPSVETIPHVEIDRDFGQSMAVGVATEDDNPAEQDGSIKLELAEQALALDLLPQARDLAVEVLDDLDSSRSAQTQAHAILRRINQIEHETAQALLPWGNVV